MFVVDKWGGKCSQGEKTDKDIIVCWIIPGGRPCRATINRARWTVRCVSRSLALRHVDPPEVKVYFLRAQCEVHVHARTTRRRRAVQRRRKLQIAACIAFSESPPASFVSLPSLFISLLYCKCIVARANAREFIVRAVNFTVKVFDYYNAIASSLIFIIARLRFLTRFSSLSFFSSSHGIRTTKRCEFFLHFRLRRAYLDSCIINCEIKL